MSQHAESLTEVARPIRRVSLTVSQSARSVLLLGSVGLAILAQSLFEPPPNHIQDLEAWQIPALLAVMAAILFGVALRRTALEQPVVPAKSLPRKKFYRLVPMFVTAVFVGLLSVLGFANNTVTLPGLILWVGSLGLVLQSLAQGDQERPDTDRSTQSRFASRLRALFAPSVPLRLRWEWLALVVVLLVGAYFRLNELSTLPAEMGGDLPYNFWDARSILNGELHVFYPANQGREGMLFYLQAAVGDLIGLSHYSLKLSTALIGLATIAALYALGKELFSAEVGLYAALFMAVGKWHVILSRAGFRVILLPLFVILAMLFLGRGLRRGRWSDYGLTGLALGLGMYTYKSFPFAILGMVICAGLYALFRTPERAGYSDTPRNRRLNTRPMLGAAVALVVAGIAYLPMARYALEHADDYFFREKLQVELTNKLYQDAANTVASQQATGQPPDPNLQIVAQGASDPWKREQFLLDNFRKSWLQFNWIGDPNNIFNVPYQRHLSLITATLFILGLGYALVRWQQGGNALVLVFLVVMMLPMTLAMFPVTDNPNIFRGFGDVGPALLLAAVALAALRRWLSGHLPTGREYSLSLTREIADPAGALPGHGIAIAFRFDARPLLVLGVAAVLLFDTIAGYHFYFQEFPSRMFDQNYSLSLDIAHTVNDFLDSGPVYIRIWPYWFDGNATRVQLTSWGRDWNNYVDQLTPSSPAIAQAPHLSLFLVHPEDRATLDLLRASFPRGVAVEHHASSDGRVAFVAFYAEK